MKKQFLTGLAAGFAIITVCAVVVLATPGDEDNPLISKAYLENNFFTTVKEYVTSKTEFHVVSVEKGKSLIGSSGCELILRQGSGKIIATEKGGLADTTSGSDLANGAKMPANHLLIIPLGDGRGFTASENVLVLVKGGYEIK